MPVRDGNLAEERACEDGDFLRVGEIPQKLKVDA
jgi:hypothetical protein